ncbi:unnamed protein product [Cladocopium goreaui]|uniref:Uncharacterized protein n=1 Tax=Cladocopium goreaui TaxID=2562237 RepID=A0A9P1CV50_9DINO|nr:unnamed protein product [Cladocopium goreaui]
MEVQVKRRGAFQKAYVSSYGEIPSEVFGENVWEHRLAQLLPKTEKRGGPKGGYGEEPGFAAVGASIEHLPWYLLWRQSLKQLAFGVEVGVAFQSLSEDWQRDCQRIVTCHNLNGLDPTVTLESEAMSFDWGCMVLSLYPPGLQIKRSWVLHLKKTVNIWYECTLWGHTNWVQRLGGQSNPKDVQRYVNRVAAPAASSSARPSEPPAPPLAEPLPAQPLAPPPPGLVGYGQITDPVMCEILRDYRISTTVGSRLSTLSLVSQAAILSRLLYKRAQDDESFDGWLMKAIRNEKARLYDMSKKDRT